MLSIQPTSAQAYALFCLSPPSDQDCAVTMGQEITPPAQSSMPVLFFAGMQTGHLGVSEPGRPPSNIK